MNVADANKTFATRLEAAYDDELKYGVYLKSDATYFGTIIESDIYDVTAQAEIKSFRFIGYSWIGNATDDIGRTVMKYPIRSDQFEANPVEAFVDLDHMSGFNQALLDALHYYQMCVSWIIPDYAPLTLKG
jgi:hypothetical protein